MNGIKFATGDVKFSSSTTANLDGIASMQEDRDFQLPSELN